MSSELKKAATGTKFLGSIMWFLAFAFLFLVFSLSARVWRHFIPSEKTLEDKRAEARVTKREALEKDNDAKLKVYAWVNKDKGIVQIPIDRAMQLVAVELNSKPVKPSAVKLENPYPYGLQNFSFIPAPPAPAATGTAAASGTAVPAPATSGTSAPAPAASGTMAPAPAASGTTVPK